MPGHAHNSQMMPHTAENTHHGVGRGRLIAGAAKEFRWSHLVGFRRNLETELKWFATVQHVALMHLARVFFIQRPTNFCNREGLRFHLGLLKCYIEAVQLSRLGSDQELSPENIVY